MPIVMRNHVLEEDTRKQIKALFYTANNAYRWLSLDNAMNMYTLARALRGETCREIDLIEIETRWHEFAKNHNLKADDFESLTDIHIYEVGMRRNSASKGPKIRSLPNGGKLVEESYDIGEDDEFF